MLPRLRMARNDNKKRGEEPEPSRWSNEITGIVLLAIGLLLALALVSYSPSNLPRVQWLEAFADKSGSPGKPNLIGPVGGVLAFIQIFLFGAAACLIPVALIWFGIVKLIRDGRLVPRKTIGFVIMLVSGSVFLDAADFFFEDWARQCGIGNIGPGGVVGYGLSELVLKEHLVGKIGTLLLSGAAYLIAMIVFTGQQPVTFLKACYRLGKARYLAYLEQREAAGYEAARKATLDEERSRQRDQRRRERETAKSEAPASQASPDGQAMLPLRETPVPQIIDASQRRASAALVSKPAEPAKSGHQSLSTNGSKNYEVPTFDILDEIEPSDGSDGANREELLGTQQVIIDTLKAFGIEVTRGDITHGPTITRYEIYPSTGLRVSRISQLEADIARATKAERINILAPIPGKDTVGIEIANLKKVAVPLRELIEDPEFQSAKKKIPLALGKDVYGKTVIADLAAMPHLLVAGATGSGKSVCINSIIASILFKFKPDKLRFIMVDPKVVEMQMYNKLPHLVVPVVTDPKKVVAALKWVVNEMEKRYRVFAKAGVRNFDAYNSRVRPEKEEVEAEPEPEDETVDEEAIESIAAALESGELGPEADEEDLIPEEDEMPDSYPYIVVLIDELADLMQTAPADVEMCIARIAQKARAAGIHLIIATQTPRADVVTGIIKANIPSRIAFQVSSALDSRVILDTKGADKLVGKGDMLYLPPGSAKLERAQGAFVSDQEVERLIEYYAERDSQKFATDIQASIDNGGEDADEEISDADEELIIRCIEVARQEQKCSTSLLQRRLRLGYTRAARMVDILEARGVVGPGDGAKPREVYLK